MSIIRSWALALSAAVVVSTGCMSGSSRQTTAGSLDRILAGNHRSEQNRARDVYRHPKETLLFFGVRPESHVVEVWPAGGWYTEVLAPLVREKGRYYAASFAPDPDSPYINRVAAEYRAKLASRPELYDKVVVTAFSRAGAEIAPAGSADLVLTFRNLHSWLEEGWAPESIALMYKALKPGGVLGVVDHRARAGAPVEPTARNGYVDETYAIKLIEAQGFKLAAKSEINANPRDTKDYEQGVWTLPPTYRLGDKDREKYAAIGESDRFTLKFVKPQ